MNWEETLPNLYGMVYRIVPHSRQEDEANRAAEAEEEKKKQIEEKNK